MLLPLKVHPRELEPGQDGYAQGEEFETDLTVEEEAENLASGLIEIVPREYKVVGTSVVFETQPGGTFEAAIPKEIGRAHV